MQDKQNEINELNYLMAEKPDRADANAVSQYNEIVGEYNNIVAETNNVADRFNKFQDYFNTLVSDISPSTNTRFINCLNIELLEISTNTTHLNIDFLIA